MKLRLKEMTNAGSSLYIIDRGNKFVRNLWEKENRCLG